MEQESRPKKEGHKPSAQSLDQMKEQLQKGERPPRKPTANVEPKGNGEAENHQPLERIAETRQDYGEKDGAPLELDTTLTPKIY